MGGSQTLAWHVMGYQGARPKPKRSPKDRSVAAGSSPHFREVAVDPDAR